jgi:hypothetical protein
MAYTTSDLASVKAAIVALASGERIALVTVGDKTIRYDSAKLSDLRALRGEIQEEIARAANTPRHRLTMTSKGF